MWRIRRCNEFLQLDLGFCRSSTSRWISSSSSSCEQQQQPRKGRFAALWGNGDFGRLRLGTLDSQWTPSVCTAFKDQSLGAISCGGAHTLFLTEAGRVYATALNDYGQLGISTAKSYTLEPLEVSGLPKEIIQISAGYYHSSAVTVDGELYMWGNNSSGQLGVRKKAAKRVFSPIKVDCLNVVRINRVALGSEHSIAITDEGEALSWGSGGSGKLGHGHQPSIFGFLRSSSEFTPRLIKTLEGIKVRTVSAGFLHSAYINENGSVFIFGEKTANKLRMGQANNATSPSIMRELPFCLDIACGGYHTCVITGGGELYTLKREWMPWKRVLSDLSCTEAMHVPESVKGPFLKFPVCKISCGWKHTAAISSGKVLTWGWGGSHETFSVDGHSSGGQLVFLYIELYTEGSHF